MNDIFHDVDSIDDAKKVLIGAKRRLKNARDELAGMRTAYASLIGRAYDDSGADVSVGNAKQVEMVKDLERALDLMAQLYGLSAKIGEKLIAAGQAEDEARAKRRMTRAHGKV